MDILAYYFSAVKYKYLKISNTLQVLVLTPGLVKTNKDVHCFLSYDL